MSFKELREKSIDELREELLSLRQTQLKLTMQKTSGQLEKNSSIIFHSLNLLAGHYLFLTHRRYLLNGKSEKLHLNLESSVVL